LGVAIVGKPINDRLFFIPLRKRFSIFHLQTFMKKIFLLLPFALLFMASQCKRKEAVFPAPGLKPTQTGANTCSCNLNGRIWEPGGFFGNSFQCSNIGGTFNLSATRKAYPNYQYLSMNHNNIFKPGTYFFKGIHGTSSSIATFGDKCSYSSTDIDSLQTSMTVTNLDTAKRIISGTFKLIFPSTGGCDSIKLTEGLFDAKY
jgi:hypothetical protein